MWAPGRLTNLWASMTCYRDSFIFTYLHKLIIMLYNCYLKLFGAFTIKIKALKIGAVRVFPELLVKKYSAISYA
jgi:hypothetical protein